MTERRVKRHIQKHIDDLDSTDQKMSVRAEGYLIRYYGAKALEPLIEACSHSNPQVRFRSGWILAHTHDPRAFDTILRLTQDPEGYVRYDAAIALGILGDDRAIVPLVSLMQQPDETSSVDSAAAMGLVRLGNRAVPALLEVFIKGTYSSRGLAASVLGSIGDERTIEPLIGLLSSQDEDVRIAGIEALAEMGGERCLAAIRQCLDDPAPRVRENAGYWVQELEKASTHQERPEDNVEKT